MDAERENRQYNAQILMGLRSAAMYLSSIGQNEKALEYMDIITDNGRDYESGDYAYDIGQIYERLGQPQEAKKYFAIAIDENPGWGKFIEAAKRYDIPLPALPTRVQLPEL